MASFHKFAIDKVWVITGAGHGIGLEMARAVAETRAIVWAIDRDAAALALLRAEADQRGWDLFVLTGDVTNAQQMASHLAAIVARCSRIDVWINNAGVQQIGAFSAMTPEMFDQVMDVNLLSTIRLSRQLVKIMEHQGFGILLNMASVAGHVPAPFMTAYVAAKHGVVGFTRALQAEFHLQKSPLRAAFASPGFVDTAIIEKGREQGFPEWLAWMLTDAKSCAKQILNALAKGQNEIQPTLSGAMMRAAYAVAPQTTVQGSRVLLTRGFKDFIANRYQLPR